MGNTSHLRARSDDSDGRTIVNVIPNNVTIYMCDANDFLSFLNAVTVGGNCAGMRRLSTAFQDPPVRLIAGWAVGLLAAVGTVQYFTDCARHDRQTLGWLSWFVSLLIACGRALDYLLDTYGWLLVAALVVLVATYAFARRRGLELRSSHQSFWMGTG